MPFFPLKMSSFLVPYPSKNPANRYYLKPNNKLNIRYLQRGFLFSGNELLFCSLTAVPASTIFPSKLQPKCFSKKTNERPGWSLQLLARVDGLTTESKLEMGFPAETLAQLFRALSKIILFKMIASLSNPNLVLLFSPFLFLH